MKLRPRLNRTSAVTAIIGVLATIAALLVAGPATATNGGTKQADQGLAYFTVKNPLNTSDGTIVPLYVGVPGLVAIKIKAVNPDPTNINIQQPIDKARIHLPGSLPISDWVFTTSAPSAGSWSVVNWNESANTVDIEAANDGSGREGLWPDDWVTITFTVTPTADGTFTEGGSFNNDGTFSPDGTGITIDAAVQHNITDPQDHAVQVAPPLPSVTVGKAEDCQAHKTCTDVTLGSSTNGTSGSTSFTIHGNKSNNPGNVTGYVDLSGGDITSCQYPDGTYAGAGPTLQFEVTTDRDGTVTFTEPGDLYNSSNDFAACWSLDFPGATGGDFYSAPLTSASQTLVSTGWLPMCTDLKSLIPSSWSDYPCVSGVSQVIKGGSVKTTTVTVSFPPGDPRVTGF